MSTGTPTWRVRREAESRQVILPGLHLEARLPMLGLESRREEVPTTSTTTSKGQLERAS